MAEEGAPLLEYEQLLQDHPSEITQEERNRQKEVQQENRSRVASAEAEVGLFSELVEGEESVKQVFCNMCQHHMEAILYTFLRITPPSTAFISHCLPIS